MSRIGTESGSGTTVPLLVERNPESKPLIVSLVSCAGRQGLAKVLDGLEWVMGVRTHVVSEAADECGKAWG